jgi:hypothetical protein
VLVALVAAPRGFPQSVAGVGGRGNKQQQTATDAADQAGIRLEAGASARATLLAEEFARLKTG